MKARGLAPISGEDEIFPRRARLEEPVERIGLDPPALHGFALEPLDHRVKLDGLGIALRQEPRHRPLHAQVLAEQHLEVQVRVDVSERHAPEHVEIEVGRRGHRARP